MEMLSSFLKPVLQNVGQGFGLPKRLGRITSSLEKTIVDQFVQIHPIFKLYPDLISKTQQHSFAPYSHTISLFILCPSFLTG